MPKKIDDALAKMKSKGLSEGSAIAILKSKGVIHQSGKHLATGPAPKAPKKK